MINPVKVWRNQSKVRDILGKTGTIISYTTVRVAPSGFEAQAPYVVALVRVGKKNYIGQLVNSGASAAIGQVVTAILRKTKQSASDEVISYGIKFIASA